MKRWETIFGFKKYASNAVVKIIIRNINIVASSQPWRYPTIVSGIADIHIHKIGIKEAKNTINAKVRRYGNPPKNKPIK